MAFFLVLMIIVPMLYVNDTNPMKDNPIASVCLIIFSLAFAFSFDNPVKDEPLLEDKQSNTIYERVAEQFKGDM